MPIDAVLTADTGMEFPEMYHHWDQIERHLLRERGLKLTILRHPKGFEWLMFDEPKEKPSSIERRNQLGVPLYGNGWPGIKVRWCTGQLKTHLITKEVNRLKKEYQAIHYVGIAADEPNRIKGECYPLVDWGITEQEALQICYNRGYDWGGLYEIYHRCSCWCCPLQCIDELRKLRRYHPALWAKLREMDECAITQFGHNPLGQFKKDWTVERLEQRFAAEDMQNVNGKEIPMDQETEQKSTNPINVLVVEPGMAPYEKEIDGLEQMQAVVGGPITASYPFEERVGIVSNDESIFRGMEFNRSIEGGYGGIFGPFFVCGLTEDSFCSLTPEQMERYKKKYHHAEILLGVKGNTPITMKVEPRPKKSPDQPKSQRKKPER